MTISQLMAQAQERDDSARELLAKLGTSPTNEQLDQIEALTAQANDLRSQADILRRVESLNQSMGAPLPRQSQGTGERAIVQSVIEGHERDPKHGFRHSVDFLHSVSQVRGNRMDNRLKPLYRSAAVGLDIRNAAGSDEQGVYDPAYGGFTIPETLMGEMLQVGADTDPSAGLTTRMTMATPTVSINARVDKNHSSSVSGGLTVARRQETGSPTASRLEMEQITFRATGLAGLAYATEELLRWSPISFVTLLDASFAQEFAAHKFNEKIRGTGVGEPEGILNSPAAITVSGEAGQAADTIVYENILNMRKRSWNYGSCVWVANHDCLPELAKLKADVGSGGQLVYQPSAREDLPDMLMGRPIFYNEFMSAIGDTGDLCLVNWSQYIDADLGSLEMAESVHVRFLENERAFRFIQYNDGKCWWRSSLTPKNGSTKSPIVILGTTNR